jgi:putative membrane protein
MDAGWKEIVDVGGDQPDVDPRTITRPHDSLLTYYILVSLATLVGFPFVILPLYIRFKTLRYRFDDEGVSMKWGLLFHKEVYLTYRRLQDIHVTRNLVERWMGLAKVPIQTASGTSGATMKIEGIRHPEPLRDFLYERMRGARAEGEETTAESPPDDEALLLLREIRDALRERRPGGGTER